MFYSELLIDVKTQLQTNQSIWIVNLKIDLKSGHVLQFYFAAIIQILESVESYFV